MKVIIYSALSGMMPHDGGLVQCLKRFHGDFLKGRHGQVHVKWREKGFTTIFRHLGPNLPPNFQLELLQKSGSKDIGGFDLCSLTMAAGGHFQAQMSKEAPLEHAAFPSAAAKKRASSFQMPVPIHYGFPAPASELMTGQQVSSVPRALPSASWFLCE